MVEPETSPRQVSYKLHLLEPAIFGRKAIKVTGEYLVDAAQRFGITHRVEAHHGAHFRRSLAVAPRKLEEDSRQKIELFQPLDNLACRGLSPFAGVYIFFQHGAAPGLAELLLAYLAAHVEVHHLLAFCVDYKVEHA